MHVLVIGGGVVGCGAAYALARRGSEITLLERSSVGSGASGAAAGMLAPLAESRSQDAFAEFGSSALAGFGSWLAEVQEAAGMSADVFAHGSVVLAAGDAQAAELADRLSWQRTLDPTALYLDRGQLGGLVSGLSPRFTAAVHYPGELSVDAARYTLALRRAAEAAGARFVEGTEVVAVDVRARDARVRLRTGAEVTGDAVLLTVGSEVALLRAVGVGLPLIAVKGEIIRLRPPGRVSQQIVFGPGGYLTPRADGSLLVGATQDPMRQDLTVRAGSVDGLLKFAFSTMPALTNAAFAGAWSGLRPQLADLLPAIGPVPGRDRLFVSLGHHRNGILLAGWSAEVIARSILESEPVPEAVSPARFPAPPVAPTLSAAARIAQPAWEPR
ncbi:MAG TPA: glycine oxidase ThiO [Candidatus Nitrosotalea sp.]|nr:glycine oxidase ThiO [Candidatus Nitrosotalea sp.]